MVTFSGWLTAQRKRDDQVGWTAKFWAGLDGKPRLSSPVSIEGHLRERGLFESTPGLTEAWNFTMDEYRKQRIMTAASEAGVSPDELAASISPAGEVQDPLPGMEGAGEPPEPVQGIVVAATVLDAINAKLDAIGIALGITIASGTITASRIADGAVTIPPIDWQAAWDSADHEAAVE